MTKRFEEIIERRKQEKYHGRNTVLDIDWMIERLHLTERVLGVLDRLVKSKVLEEAPFIGYSEAFAEAKALLNDLINSETGEPVVGCEKCDS